MSSLITLAIAICLGCSPLGNSRILKIIVIALLL